MKIVDTTGSTDVAIVVNGRHKLNDKTQQAFIEAKALLPMELHFTEALEIVIQKGLEMLKLEAE